MLKLISEAPMVVSAKLTKPVLFVKRGKDVTIDAGTTVALDIDTNICFVNGDHIQLNPNDFIVIREN